MPQFDVGLLFNFVVLFSLSYIILYFLNKRFPLKENMWTLKFKVKIVNLFSKFFFAVKDKAISLYQKICKWLGRFF